MDNDANDVSLSPCVHYLYQETWANHIVGFQKQLVNGRINNEWKRKLSKKKCHHGEKKMGMGKTEIKSIEI